MISQDLVERITNLQLALIKNKQEKREKHRQTIAKIENNIMNLESYPEEQVLTTQIQIYKDIVGLLKEQ